MPLLVEFKIVIITKKISITHGAIKTFSKTGFLRYLKELPPPADITAYPIIIISITCLGTNLTYLNVKQKQASIITSLVHLFQSILTQQPQKIYVIGVWQRFEGLSHISFAVHSKLNFSLWSFTTTPTLMFAHDHSYNLNVVVKNVSIFWGCIAGCFCLISMHGSQRWHSFRNDIFKITINF